MPKPTIKIETDLASRPGVRAFDAELMAELATFLALRGITAERSKAVIHEDGLTVSLRFRKPRPDGKTPAQAEWEMYAPLLDLPVDAFGKTIRLQGSLYTVNGCAPSKPKNCVKIVRADGKQFQCPASTLLNALARGLGAEPLPNYGLGKRNRYGN